MINNALEETLKAQSKGRVKKSLRGRARRPDQS